MPMELILPYPPDYKSLSPASIGFAILSKRLSALRVEILTKNDCS